VQTWTLWADIPPAWQTCIELAFDAYGQGTVPVGAVLVDAGGREVARGRNALYAGGPNGAPLAGTHLAHAEMIALMQVSSEGQYPEHTLYGSLEPCIMCAGTACMAGVGTVRFAGIDPYGGAAELISKGNAHLRRGLTRFEGPVDGPAGLFCSAMHMEFYLRRKPDGHVVRAYRESAPEAVTAARLLAELDAPGTAAAGAPVSPTFDAFAARLG
jgi:tRNA(Arg) A34 adenosine deaminase TadA